MAPKPQQELELVLSRKLQQKVKLTPRPVVKSLPVEDSEELRTMAIKSTWQSNILNTPVYIARKCPVLPGFIPRSVGHGITVPTRDDASFDENSSFHGLPFPNIGLSKDGKSSAPPSPTTQQKEKTCPYL